jgi:ketosteroid isomerase-like protein
MRKRLGGFGWARSLACLLAVVLIFAASASAWAGQKNKKSKNKDADNSNQPLPSMPSSDFDQIDRDIGEMLAGFQLGDSEMMHKYYADNATFVRGTYDPPVVGWQNYAALYNQQRTAFQGMQLIRKNTFIFTHEDVAWATYQWEFISMANGQPYSDRGQTTLVFNKIGGKWLIVHNHTSEAVAQPAGTQGPPAQPTAPQQAPPPKP